MGLLRARMTCGKVTDQIIESIPLSCALSEFCDDAQSEWVAADSGQMLTQKVGGSAEVAGGRGADHIAMTPETAPTIRTLIGSTVTDSTGADGHLIAQSMAREPRVSRRTASMSKGSVVTRIGTPVLRSSHSSDCQSMRLPPARPAGWDATRQRTRGTRRIGLASRGG
jgi:hypothetical protein